MRPAAWCVDCGSRAWDCALLVHDQCEPLYRWHSRLPYGAACHREIGEYLFIGRRCDTIDEQCQ